MQLCQQHYYGSQSNNSRSLSGHALSCCLHGWTTEKCRVQSCRHGYPYRRDQDRNDRSIPEPMPTLKTPRNGQNLKRHHSHLPIPNSNSLHPAVCSLTSERDRQRQAGPQVPSSQRALGRHSTTRLQVLGPLPTGGLMPLVSDQDSVRLRPANRRCQRPAKGSAESGKRDWSGSPSCVWSKTRSSRGARAKAVKLSHSQLDSRLRH